MSASSPLCFPAGRNEVGSGSACQSASQPAINLKQVFLKQVFTDIATGVTPAGLVPDNTHEP